MSLAFWGEGGKGSPNYPLQPDLATRHCLQQLAGSAAWWGIATKSLSGTSLLCLGENHMASSEGGKWRRGALLQE